MPAVERPESGPDEALPGLSLKRDGPDAGMIYPMPPPVALAPTRRNDDPKLRNANGLLGLDERKFGQDAGAGKPLWENYPTDYSPQPGSNDLNSLRAWGTSANSNNLGRATDKLDSV